MAYGPNGQLYSITRHFLHVGVGFCQNHIKEQDFQVLQGNYTSLA